MKRKILIFENSFTLTNYFLKKWRTLAEESIAFSGRFNVALSGGRSPTEFYIRLSSLKDFDLWKNTHIYQADERFVPADDKENNFRMIKTNLLDYINIPPENIHPINTELETVELCAEDYKNTLQETLDFSKNNLPRFDFILLGIGADGHTASLFPGDENIHDPNRVTLPVHAPHLKHERISLTLPVMNNARNIVFLALGQKKAEMIHSILEKSADVPAAKVQLTDGELTFLLDREAAQNLQNTDSFVHEDEAIVITDE